MPIIRKSALTREEQEFKKLIEEIEALRDEVKQMYEPFSVHFFSNDFFRKLEFEIFQDAKMIEGRSYDLLNDKERMLLQMRRGAEAFKRRQMKNMQ